MNLCVYRLTEQLRLDHLCLDQAPILSPLFTSTYGDEDMVIWRAFVFEYDMHIW